MADFNGEGDILIDEEGRIDGTDEDVEIGRQMFRDKVDFKVVEADPRLGIRTGYDLESIFQ